MDKFAAAPSPYPFASYKVLHLVRHAQGVHNLESEKSRDPLTSFEYFDAELSSQGWQQVCDQRRYVCASGLLEKIEVVITSPMTRTLQTAVGIFRGEGQPADRFYVTPFEEENVKNAETSTFNRLPIISYELCRERMGKYECDKRRSISLYRSRFPDVDFSLIESEDDVLWKGEKESHEAVVARGMKFIKWLCGRKEKEIAVVSHGVFLQQAMTELIKSNKCCPLMEGDPLSRFKNCEIRSIAIFYESVMGLESDSLPTTIHCGRIPYGLELPRDSAKENISVEEVTN
ncbi:PREDICTED: phosphoglycerate mutase-like protein 1 [Theobroma cacao]|uniref:Phosphoglycerate mutase-like protein 1 n=1 Tax=Theobroma cacao TaxID=3641 RepID=A0AB32UV30_THECC|nr:PREDICTED: phosphoglycerate mutase-like protein 1 [Theobroma cacao]XP_007018326.2 PREDICTED: phosphoglycerate mutase-like protein 1 [Theobroma cacao]XP_017981799.1 PREDICTED: phosphoglycerate mutase-like protein 1 [Theobroma cacao]XP_017981800.1 PREDICTED: phosphoglycerate mutase-like protein 1 [Theobroma cacao]